jgi:hypothetical protein
MVEFVCLHHELSEFFRFFILIIKVVSHLLIISDRDLAIDQSSTALNHLLYLINNKLKSLTNINQSGVLRGLGLRALGNPQTLRPKPHKTPLWLMLVSELN